MGSFLYGARDDHVHHDCFHFFTFLGSGSAAFDIFYQWVLHASGLQRASLGFRVSGLIWIHDTNRSFPFSVDGVYFEATYIGFQHCISDIGHGAEVREARGGL
jgi:hypothetical protein